MTPRFPNPLLWLSALLWTLLPTVALAAPPPAEADAEAKSNFILWVEYFREMLSDDVLAMAWRILLAIGLFVVGWLAAKFVSWVTYRLLLRTSIDNALAEKLGLSMLFEGKEDEHPLERAMARIVHWLLMALVVIAVLDFAGLSQAAAPIQRLVETVVSALPLVGKAIVLMVIAYIAGAILSKLVTKGLDLARVDSRFAELSGEKVEDGETDKPFSQSAGQVVFWLILVIGLAGAFDALQITPLADPLRNALDQVIGLLPSIGVSVLLVIGGWVLGRIARAVVSNLLDSLGLNNLIAKLKLSGLFGQQKASHVIGWIAMAFIMIQSSLAALNELGLETLSEPITDMMTGFWKILPSVAVSTVFVVLGVFLGRLARGILTPTLKNVGFDKLMARLGFEKIADREHMGHPSEVVGFAVQAAIVLLALAQALANLKLETWASYVDGFLIFSVTHAVVALVIVGVGFAIGNYVRDLINARQEAGTEGPQWLGEFARYAVLVFAFTMAVHQLGVAEDFVLLSFALLFGGLCLAMALAFGLGAREVASEIVRKRWTEAKKASGTRPAGTTPPQPGSPFSPPPGGGTP